MHITLTQASQFSQLLRRGGNILVAILLAKTYLQPSDLGVYETLSFLCSFVDFFWLNALIQAGFSLYPSLSAKEKKQFFFQQFLLFSLFSGLLCFIFIFFKTKLLLLLTCSSNLPFYELYWYFLLFHFPSFLIESIYLLQKQAQALFLYALSSFLLQQMLFFFPIWNHWDFKYSFYGLILLAIIKYSWLIINILKYGMIDFKNHFLKNYFSIALPLIAYSLLSGIAVNFDSILINWFYEGDKTLFALYRYGARELPLVSALAMGLSNAMIPALAADFAQGLQLLKQKSTQLAHFLFPCSLLLLLSSQYWYPKVFRADFAQSSSIFDIYLLLIISRLIFSNTVLIALKDTKVLLKISILETLLNMLLSILGIYYGGLQAVAWATVIAYCFEKIAIAWYLKQKAPLSSYLAPYWYFFYTFSLLFAYFVKTYS